jgi:cellobiose-specific phosphotransferase system component IIC
VRRLSEAPRRVGEAVNESFGSIVPAFQASILFFVCNHALTRAATACRRFAPRFLARPGEAQGRH